MIKNKILIAIVLIILSVTLQQSLFIQAQDGGGQFPITITDATGNEVTITSLDAIVSGSGDVTEILVALGFQDQLAGIDISSTYPPNLDEHIQIVGFARRLALEPILAVNPTVFFCTEICSPIEVLDQLRELDIPVVIIPDNESSGINLPLQKIEMVAQALGVPEKGEALINQVRIEMDWVNTALANVEEEAPYILMVYVRGTSLQLISGSDVPAEAMITHAGGIDAGTDIGVSGYTPLNAELVLTSFPDYVLLMRDGVDSAGGLDFIKKLPGISQVPAGQNNQFIVIDDMFLLGMSTRTGYSLLNLAKNFFPTMTWELNVDYPYSFTDATGQEVVIEQEPAIIVTSDSLFNIVQNLGYHPLRIENMIPEGLALATMNDDWQSLRDNGYQVIVIADETSISEIANALGVAGRGTALLARELQR